LTILAIVAGVVTLAAAALATGLAAADGRADLAALAALGTSPRMRRALSLSQAGVIAGLGSIIGTLAGLGTAIAVLITLNQATADAWPLQQPRPIIVPWLNIATALVVVLPHRHARRRRPHPLPPPHRTLSPPPRMTGSGQPTP
jgi:putative ABC transport system permease protein